MESVSVTKSSDNYLAALKQRSECGGTLVLEMWLFVDRSSKNSDTLLPRMLDRIMLVPQTSGINLELASLSCL